MSSDSERTATSRTYKRRGDPKLGVTPLVARPKMDVGPRQLYPGSVAVTTRSASTWSPSDTDVFGQVVSSDLNVQTTSSAAGSAAPTYADPRWREVWTLKRWDLFHDGVTELWLVPVNDYDKEALARALGTGLSDGLVEYNYMYLTDGAVTVLSRPVDNLVPRGTRLLEIREVKDGQKLGKGWLFRTLGENNWVYDVWVLLPAYEAPTPNLRVSLKPRSPTYADAAAFLNDMKAKRGAATDWMAVCALYQITSR